MTAKTEGGGGAVSSAYDFDTSNLKWRNEVYARTMHNAVAAIPFYQTANPSMDKDQAFLTAIHGELMNIIEKLFGSEDDAPTECPSDTAYEIMAALGFHEAQAIEARRAATLGAVHESVLGIADAADPHPERERKISREGAEDEGCGAGEVKRG